jgi:hypothetical protein
MSHTLDIAIREQLARYLANEISLRDFKEWFFCETWDVDQKAGPALTDFIYGIKLDLAEFSHGDWTESELHRLLRASLEEHACLIPQ